jgi:hypothetical protein
MSNRVLLLVACHRPAYWSQGVIAVLEPVADRRNGATGFSNRVVNDTPN